MQARIGFDGRQFHYEQSDVALTSGANTATAVTFDTAYSDVPNIRVVSHYGLGGTADGAGGHPNFAVKTVTRTGFVWNISGTGLGNVTIPVVWFAHAQI